MMDHDRAVAVAAAAIAARRDPGPALDHALSAGLETDFPPEGLSEAHRIAGRIAVALHPACVEAFGQRDDPVALLPGLAHLALTPMNEDQTGRALAQLLATLQVYHDDAEALRAHLPRPPRAALNLRHLARRLLRRAR